MKVDVVYPLAPLSKNGEDWELRYSLRSLAAQPWVGTVFLVGHRPDWAQNIVHVPCDDPHKSKDANIIRKILYACRIPELSSQFVINSDDHYIMKILRLMDLGPWLEHPSSLKDAYLKQAVSRWYIRLIKTVDYCNRRGFPQWVFESHIPYMVEKDRYIKTMLNIPFDKGIGLMTHVYYNLTLDIKPLKTIPGSVVRLKSEKTYDEIKEMMKYCMFLNHNDTGLSDGLKQILSERFPEPSPWEK